MKHFPIIFKYRFYKAYGNKGIRENTENTETRFQNSVKRNINKVRNVEKEIDKRTTEKKNGNHF